MARIDFKNVVDYIRFHPAEASNGWKGLATFLEQFLAQSSLVPTITEEEDESPDELVVVAQLLRQKEIRTKEQLCVNIVSALKVALRRSVNRKDIPDDVLDAIFCVLTSPISVRAAAETCNCLLNICYNSNNAARVARNQEVTVSLLKLIANADISVQTPALGALQSLCFHTEGRHALRIQLPSTENNLKTPHHRYNSASSSTAVSDNLLFQATCTIRSLLLPIPFSPDDTLFSGEVQHTILDKDGANAKSRKVRQQRERLTLLQRALGCFHNLLSDAALAEMIAPLDIYGTIVAYLDVPYPELVKAALGAVHNLTRVPRCHPYLLSNNIEYYLDVLLLSSDIRLQLSAANSVINLVAPTFKTFDIDIPSEQTEKSSDTSHNAHSDFSPRNILKQAPKLLNVFRRKRNKYASNGSQEDTFSSIEQLQDSQSISDSVAFDKGDVYQSVAETESTVDMQSHHVLRATVRRLLGSQITMSAIWNCSTCPEVVDLSDSTFFLQ